MSSLCYSHILVSFRIVTSMGANSGPIIWSRITFLQKKKEIKKERGRSRACRTIVDMKEVVIVVVDMLTRTTRIVYCTLFQSEPSVSYGTNYTISFSFSLFCPFNRPFQKHWGFLQTFLLYFWFFSEFYWNLWITSVSTSWSTDHILLFLVPSFINLLVLLEILEYSPFLLRINIPTASIFDPSLPSIKKLRIFKESQ